MSWRNRVLNRCRYLASCRVVTYPIRLKTTTPLISFSFDDFPASAYTQGGTILKEFGFTGTYYTSLGLAGTTGPVGRCFDLEMLPLVVADGHELGCHTHDHCHAWQTAPREYERSIVRNGERLQELMPGARFQTHAYPISYPRPGTKRRTARHFRCARGGEQRTVQPSPDRTYLNAFFIEKAKSVDEMLQKIEALHSNPAWLIFATHDVDEAPTRFGCTPSVFRQVVAGTKQAGIEVLPVAAALARLTNETPAASARIKLS